jgi:hypothetical protein
LLGELIRVQPFLEARNSVEPVERKLISFNLVRPFPSLREEIYDDLRRRASHPRRDWHIDNMMKQEAGAKKGFPLRQVVSTRRHQINGYPITS